MRSSGLQEVGRKYALHMVAVGVVLYSIGPVLIGAGDSSGTVISFWRLWFGVPIFGIATLAGVRLGAPRPTRSGWRWAALAGLAFGGHQLLFFSAVRAAGVTSVVLMNVLAPLLVAAAAVPLFGERISRQFRVWSLLAIGGAVLVILGGSSGPNGSPVGMVMAAGNVVFFVAFFLTSKISRRHIDVLPYLFGVLLVAAITVTLWAFISAEPVAHATTRDFIVAASIAAGPGAVGHFVMTWPLNWVPANVPPVMRLAQPVIAGFLAWLLLSEAITASHLGGGALTLIGVLGAIRARPPSPPVAHHQH